MARETILQSLATSEEFIEGIDAGVAVVPDISDLPDVQFNYGIASGDPDAESVVLWTHAENAESEGRKC